MEFTGSLCLYVLKRIKTYNNKMYSSFKSALLPPENTTRLSAVESFNRIFSVLGFSVMLQF